MDNTAVDGALTVAPLETVDASEVLVVWVVAAVCTEAVGSGVNALVVCACTVVETALTCEVVWSIAVDWAAVENGWTVVVAIIAPEAV